MLLLRFKKPIMHQMMIKINLSLKNMNKTNGKNTMMKERKKKMKLKRLRANLAIVSEGAGSQHHPKQKNPEVTQLLKLERCLNNNQRKRIL